MRRLCAATAALALLGLSMAASAAITIDTVRIGDPGNEADTASHSGNPAGQGSVAYAYNIGEYEVTAGQYTAFLNAKAATDAYGLYNTNMWSSPEGCKIQQSGSAGNYSYSVASDYANRPVNYVSYWDSCRFANWLGNGQGNGDTENGAYTLDGYNGSDGRAIQRNAGWTWAVTNEDEWYKAAHYKGGGLYSLYANGTDTAPAAGTASNYNLAVGNTWDGSVSGALEQSGTRDMIGNVWERNEAIVYQDIAYRGRRGGSFNSAYAALQSSYRSSGNPDGESNNLGFRVSQVVPEPACSISNKSAYDPIMSTASARFSFRVLGKVTILVSGNSFTVDDGSGMPVRVAAPGLNGIQDGDHAEASGMFSGEGSNRVLNAQASDVVKLR